MVRGRGHAVEAGRLPGALALTVGEHLSGGAAAVVGAGAGRQRALRALQVGGGGGAPASPRPG